MADKDISGKLQQARLNKNLKQKDVYKKLGVLQSRFSAWETGKSEPKIEHFLELCRIYEIDDIYTYFLGANTKYNKNQYSTKLQLAINKLRDLYADEESFRRVLNCLDFEYEEFFNKKSRRLEFGTTKVKVYLQRTAAGLGNYLSDDDCYEEIYIAAPPDTDIGVRISGDSMEPDICDDEIVFVKCMPYVEHGDIGIFVYQGEAYCKKLEYIDGKPFLISLNPKYFPLPINENEEIRTVGKVLI